MLAKIIGKHNLSLARAWLPTAAMFSSGGGLFFLYLTDWKLILQYLPIYNTKFKESES
ncbi:Cytochrome b-c1 complex subunit 10, partial [Stegodyphus mimosarum]